MEWLEDFKSKFGEYLESHETVEECEALLETYNNVVEAVRIPLMIQNARNARKADGSCLEYGIEYHLKNLNAAVCILLNNAPTSILLTFLYSSLRKVYQVIHDSQNEIMNGLKLA